MTVKSTITFQHQRKLAESLKKVLKDKKFETKVVPIKIHISHRLAIEKSKKNG